MFFRLFLLKTFVSKRLFVCSLHQDTLKTVSEFIMDNSDALGLFLREHIKPIILEAIEEKLRQHLPPPKPQADDESFLTRSEAAKVLGVGLCTLDKLTKYGNLQKYRNGSIVRLKKSEVLEAFKTYEKRKRHQFDGFKT